MLLCDKRGRGSKDPKMLQPSHLDGPLTSARNFRRTGSMEFWHRALTTLSFDQNQKCVNLSVSATREDVRNSCDLVIELDRPSSPSVHFQPKQARFVRFKSYQLATSKSQNTKVSMGTRHAIAYQGPLNEHQRHSAAKEFLFVEHHV